MVDRAERWSAMIFVGVDWAEAHNDVLVMDEPGSGSRSGCGVRSASPGSRSCTLWWPSMLRGSGRCRGRHRDRPRLVGRCARGGRLPGLRREPPGGQPLPRSPHRHRAPSPMPVTPSSWPTWCAPTPTTTARWPATRTRRARSGCSRGPIRASSGRGSARSTACARLCAITSRRRSMPSRTDLGQLGCPGGARHRSKTRPGPLAVALGRSPRPLGAVAANATSSRRARRDPGGPARRAAPRARRWPIAFGASERRHVSPSLVSLSRPDRRARGRARGAFMIVTRTPRSCAVFPDSAWSSAPGCLANSGTTRVACPMLEAERPTREPPPSPGPRAAASSSWRASRETGAWPMPVSAGPSAH